MTTPLRKWANFINDNNITLPDSVRTTEEAFDINDLDGLPSSDIKDHHIDSVNNMTLADFVKDFESAKDVLRILLEQCKEGYEEHEEFIDNLPTSPHADYQYRVVVAKLDTPEEWFENFQHETKRYTED